MGGACSKSKSKNKVGSTMAEFDIWLYKRLRQYFTDIETLILSIKVTPEVKQDIGESVEDMMGSIFKEIGAIDRRLTVKKSGLIKVGEFYENSEIICIDEIDIYAVLENLSGEDVITVENTTTEYFETLQVCLKDKYVPRWLDCIADDDSDKKILSGEKMVNRVYDAMETAIEHLRTKSHDVIYKKHGYLELLGDDWISKRGCRICLKFCWNGNTFFSVKVTPVLKVNKTESYVLHDEVLTETIFDAVTKCGPILLVPDKGAKNFFKLSLAHTECYLMNKVVSTSHKRVYRLLQFLVDGYSKTATGDCGQIFAGEQLKTLLLMHDMICGKTDTIEECTMVVVDNMKQLLERCANENKMFLSSVFVNHMNTFKYSTASTGNEMIDLNLSAIAKVEDHLINDVGCSSSYNFKDVISRFVPVNEFVLHADYLARKSRVDFRADMSGSTSDIKG